MNKINLRKENLKIIGSLNTKNLLLELVASRVSRHFNDVCPVIFDKTLLSNSSTINSVKHMLQNSESATKRCSIIVSYVL